MQAQAKPGMHSKIMTGQPLISVIIPVYNEEKYLAKTLASLEKQTINHSWYEVIVVDNGSTDKTNAIAKEYGVRIIREEKKGICFAREAGLRAAKGEVIASTDADTILPPFWLERIWDSFQTNVSLIGTFGSYQMVCEDGSPYMPIWIYKFLDLFFFLSCRLSRPFFTGSNYAVARELLTKAEVNLSSWGDLDDLPVGLLASSLGRVVFDPNLIVCNSARRIKHEGLVKTLVVAIVDYLQVAWFRRQIFRKRKDYR